MGTQVLQPQDCLIERIRTPSAVFSRRRSSGHHSCNYYHYNNYNNYVNAQSNRKPGTRPDQRKRVVVGSGQTEVSVRKSSVDDSRMTRSSGVAMEKVTILRRGQSLDSSSVAVKSDVYAGSAFVVSPSPSALPLPSFPTKKQSSVAYDDSATRDLRRLLRLE